MISPLRGKKGPHMLEYLFFHRIPLCRGINEHKSFGVFHGKLKVSFPDFLMESHFLALESILSLVVAGGRPGETHPQRVF